MKDTTKQSDEVWVRWFFISNWSPLKAVEREKVQDHMREVCGWYDPKFQEKAKFEIIDGNLVREVEAKTL